MDEVQRSEYPAMLANLQPSQAVQVVNERLKRIGKVNTEIADWLQERRRLEDQYVAGLKKLLLFKVPNASSDLGIFQPSWDKILHSTDAIAASHHLFAQRVEKDVEQDLRQFQNRKEYQNMTTMSANLSAIAKEFEDAREKADKLTRKGGKASALKVDQATARLESATGQWESQAPFILETLQALDEQRCNHLRDVLTQLQTHEVDQADRLRATANDALTTILEADTSKEVDNFATRATAGRPKVERRTGTGTGSMERTPTTTRQSSSTNVQPPSTADSSLAPPPTAASFNNDDDRSDHSTPGAEKSENKLRSRIGTMLGRRRQSVHGGFGQLSPGKNAGPFNRASSSHGRLSPHASASNLAISTGRLDALTEAPDTPRLPKPEVTEEAAATNGTHAEASDDNAPPRTIPTGLNGMTAEEIFDAPPPPGPPPSHLNKEGEPAKDEEGFTIPAPANDPISQAQRDAADEAGEEHEQLFKLNIQNSPIAEEDPDESKAAQLSVANTLSTMQMPARRTGTVRGRRDVRNTMYMPSPPTLPGADAVTTSLSPGEPTQNLPPSPALQGAGSSMSSRPSAIHTLASEASVTGTSDTQSVRSATSLGGLAHGKHPDLTAPGLNSSIVETVSASFEGGVLKSVRINGEIAFAYNGDGTVSEAREAIRINDFPSLESIGPNRIFVSSTPSPDEFTLDLSHIPPKTATPGFTYRVHAEEPTSAHLASHCPLIINPAWKPTGDKLGLLLQYKPNPDFKPNADKPAVLKGLTIIATYTNARASGVQTKPAGTHLKDKHLVYWRLGDVTLQPGADWQKIVCRVIGAENGEPKPGNIEARWEYISSGAAWEEEEDEGSHSGGISISRKREGKGKGKATAEDENSDSEDDPFADESAAVSPRLKDESVRWQHVPTVRKIVSGKYEAK
ncbi:hypothetical protein diail_10835 [Diaporthe ilicicola]|nr:hypothetical protein diail_10835 [Diaporthe ilicicola]